MLSQKITLDFCHNDYKTVTVKQYDKDSRNLLITCTNNGSIYKLDSSTHECNVKMSTPDNRAIYDSAIINDDGTVLIVFTESMVYASGTGKLEIQVIEPSSKRTLSSMILTVIIVGSVYSDDVIIASDEFNALTDTLLNISENVEKTNEALEKVNEAVEICENASNEHAIAAAQSASNAAISESNANAYANSAKDYVDTANNYATIASTKATEASESADIANIKANDASASALLAESYTVGGTDIRENENVDNAKYYKEQAERISQGLAGALLPMGTISFSKLAEQTKITGYMYNISDDFITDDTFKDGSGYTYSAGTNVYYTADGFWDCIAGTQVVGVKGDAENSYRKGNINITAENVGAASRQDVDNIQLLMGATDISEIGDGTVTGGLKTVNDNLANVLYIESFDSSTGILVTRSADYAG